MEPVASVLDILQGESEVFVPYFLPTITTLKRKLTSLTGLLYRETLKTAVSFCIDERH